MSTVGLTDGGGLPWDYVYARTGVGVNADGTVVWLVAIDALAVGERWRECEPPRRADGWAFTSAPGAEGLIQMCRL